MAYNSQCLHITLISVPTRVKYDTFTRSATNIQTTFTSCSRIIQSYKGTNYIIVFIMDQYPLATFIPRFFNLKSSRCSLYVRLLFITLFRSLSLHVHSAFLFSCVSCYSSLHRAHNESQPHSKMRRKQNGGTTSVSTTCFPTYLPQFQMTTIYLPQLESTKQLICVVIRNSHPR